jgi:hypothetical protein
MPETTPAAPVAPAASSAPESVKAESTTPAPPPPIQEQSKPQEPVKPAVDPTAAALAQTKRFAAKAQADREASQRLNADRKDWETKAQRYDYLDKLRQDDPLEFAKQMQLDPYDLSKRQLEKVTGQGKSPADLVREEVDRRFAAEAKAHQEAQEKAAKDENLRRNKQTLEGAKTALGSILTAGAAKYELSAAQDPGLVVEMAWKKVTDTFAKTQEILGFDKALAAVEYDYKLAQLHVFGKKLPVGTTEEVVNAEWDKAKAIIVKQMKADADAEAAAKAKPQGLSAKTSRVESRPVVETEKPSPTPNPMRRVRPLDYQQMAKQLWEEHNAKTDN